MQSKQRLREEVERLHEELSRSESLDAESRERLAQLAQDIESALERAEGEEAGGLAERLREATARFEESHPALTAVVGRIADQLSRLGI